MTRALQLVTALSTASNLVTLPSWKLKCIEGVVGLADDILIDVQRVQNFQHDEVS